MAIVLYPLSSDDCPGLLQRIKDLAVEKLVPRLPVERIDVAVIPLIYGR